MNDQESMQESHQRTSVESFLNHQLSDLHLDNMRTASSTNAVCNRASGVDDSVSQVDFSDRSPPRKRLYRRFLSSPQPPAGADAGVHRLISEVNQFLDLPGGDSGQRDSSSLQRYISHDCTGGKPIPAAKVENQTQRSLFPSPLSLSSATADILPPLPLSRTVADPVRPRSLSSPMIRNTTPVPRTDDDSSTAVHLLPPLSPLARTTSNTTRLTNSILQNEGFTSTEESSFDKRLKRASSIEKIRQHMDEITYWIDQMVEEESAMINVPIIPEPETISNEAPPQEEAVEKEMEEEDDLEADADMVKARKVGECTMLEFKCRCGSLYSVAIFGNSCYYKLT